MRERFTVGVEEEYQLVEPATGELRSRARVVRRADLSGEVIHEIHETMLEVGTPVCADAAQLATALRDRRFQAAAAAAAEDLDVVAAGTHPFSGWKGHLMTAGDRPRMLAGRFRHILRQLHIWGMHVHVAVPPEFDRLRLMNVVRAYVPHLLALSCSSPFHFGEDTGFASFRAITWRGFPFTGVPPRFESEAEYREFFGLLLRNGVVPDGRTLYWSVRPSARYPTLEMRMCDVCPRLADAVAIAALARALVVAAAREELDPIGESLSASLQDELLTENEWVVARDGLDAILISPETADGRLPVRRAVADLLARVAPLLEMLGDGPAIRGIETILRTGNAADRMRARYRAGGGLRGLVEWLVQETRAGTGIDRRRFSRDDPEKWHRSKEAG